MNDVMQGRWTLLHVIGLVVWQKHVKSLSLVLTGLRGCACLAIVVLWGMEGTRFSSVLPLLFCGLGMPIYSQTALTPRGHLLLSSFPLCPRQLSGSYLNMIAIVGTSDRPCWLAEACEILLLLLPLSK